MQVVSNFARNESRRNTRTSDIRRIRVTRGGPSILRISCDACISPAVSLFGEIRDYTHFNGRCYDLNLSLNAASYVLSTVTIYSGIVLSWLLAIFSAALLKIMISKWTDIPVFITFAFFIVPLILIIAAYITIFITARKSFQGQRKMSLKRVIMGLVCTSFSVWEISRVLMLMRSFTHFDARCVKFHAFRNAREVSVCPKH